MGELGAPNKMERQKEHNSKLETEMQTSHNLIKVASLVHLIIDMIMKFTMTASIIDIQTLTTPAITSVSG